MSKITPEEISKVARLARIKLTDEELGDMTEELGSILDFVARINAADTEDIEPTSQVTGLKDVWREDKIKRSKVVPKDLLAGAPSTQDGYVKVKKVL